MKEFDLEEMSKYDGKDGRPCYIAHGNRVIDVSRSKLWKTGTHMKRHQAGSDLTSDIAAAPHGTEVLDKYPQVGILKKKAAEQFLPSSLEMLLEQILFYVGIRTLWSFICVCIFLFSLPDHLCAIL